MKTVRMLAFYRLSWLIRKENKTTMSMLYMWHVKLLNLTTVEDVWLCVRHIGFMLCGCIGWYWHSMWRDKWPNYVNSQLLSNRERSFNKSNQQILEINQVGSIILPTISRRWFMIILWHASLLTKYDEGFSFKLEIMCLHV